MALEKLGPYRLERVLGQGGMGVVYAGVDERTGTRAAVKVLLGNLDDRPNLRLRFEAEIESLKRLRHANIVQLYAYGEEDGRLFYSMELVDGRSLQDELKSGRIFSVPETLRIGFQIAIGLKLAHDSGIIHRDIKPANLLLTRDGLVKLTDFGIAKLFGGSQVTADGGVVGTVDYMSPEQAEGKPVTYRSDLYAVGGVLYALLARIPPFGGRSVPQIIHALRFDTPPPLHIRAPLTPPDVEELIQKLLAKDPKDRVPTALVLAKRLQELARRYPLAKPPSLPPGAPPPPVNPPVHPPANPPVNSPVTPPTNPQTNPQTNPPTNPPVARPEPSAKPIQPSSSSADRTADDRSPSAPSPAARGTVDLTWESQLNQLVPASDSPSARTTDDRPPQRDPLAPSGPLEPLAPLDPLATNTPGTDAGHADPLDLDSLDLDAFGLAAPSSTTDPADPLGPNPLTGEPLSVDPLGQDPLGLDPLGPNALGPDPRFGQSPSLPLTAAEAEAVRTAESLARLASRPLESRRPEIGKTESGKPAAGKPAAGLPAAGQPESREPAGWPRHATVAQPGGGRQGALPPTVDSNPLHPPPSLLPPSIAPPSPLSAGTGNGSQGDARLSAASSRFTTVAEDEHRRQLERQREALEQRSHFVIKTAAAVVVVALLAGGAVLLSRPPGADSLYEELKAAASREDEGALAEVEPRIKLFLESHPADPRVAEVTQWKAKLDIAAEQRRFDRRFRRWDAAAAMGPVERLYGDAMQEAATRPDRALDQLRAIVDAYAAHPPDDAAAQRSLKMATGQIERLEQLVRQQRVEELALARAQLRWADEQRGKSPEKAAAVYRGLAKLYAEKPWAEPLLKELRERQASQSTPSPSPSPSPSP